MYHKTLYQERETQNVKMLNIIEPRINPVAANRDELGCVFTQRHCIFNT